MSLFKKVAPWMLLIVFLYMCYMPNKILVDLEGEPIGMVNQFRDSWHGEKFWAKQVKLIEEEIAYLESVPQRLSMMEQRQEQVNQEVDRIVQEANVQLEEIYSGLPMKARQELMPSPEEQLADKMREESDRLEYQAMMDKMELWRQAKLKKMYDLLYVVKAKA